MSTFNPEIKDFLDEKVVKYNNPDFIDSDPIFIPHQFTQKEDIEISGFLAASIAWGNRKMIIKNATKLINLMGNAPFDFIMSHKDSNLDNFNSFVHRTFNATDAKFFIKSLKNIYQYHNGLESVFSKHSSENSVTPAIQQLNNVFFSIPHPSRTRKHIANPAKGAAAKRINMFLRWMVRNDKRGVDFGIWESLSPKVLSCPLDVHTGNVARKLGLLTRKSNDIKSVMELDVVLRLMDKNDPVKYDFALFGLGVFENF